MEMKVEDGLMEPLEIAPENIKAIELHPALIVSSSYNIRSGQ